MRKDDDDPLKQTHILIIYSHTRSSDTQANLSLYHLSDGQFSRENNSTEHCSSERKLLAYISEVLSLRRKIASNNFAFHAFRFVYLVHQLFHVCNLALQ